MFDFPQVLAEDMVQTFEHPVVGRYKGSMLGIFWSLATPIFMLAVYTFVFSVVFALRSDLFGHYTRKSDRAAGDITLNPDPEARMRDWLGVCG